MPEKFCTLCNEPFKKRDRDSQEQWRTRRFCSKDCANAHSGDQRMKPLEERFWENVIKGDDQKKCWAWSGVIDQHGYGKISKGRFGEGAVRAHRLSWEINKGPIPKGLVVIHICDNPNCVNPDHLKIGTQKANMLDCKEKGRLGRRGNFGSENSSAKLDERSVQLIRVALAHGVKYPPLAEASGVHTTTIGLIARNMIWKNVEGVKNEQSE